MSAHLFSSVPGCKDDDVISPKANEKDIYVQLVISMALGVSSFVAFCVGLTMQPSILRLIILTLMRSYSVRDGKASMRPENDKAMQLWPCRTYRIRFSAGYQCYTR